VNSFKKWMQIKGLDYRVLDQVTVKTQLEIMGDYIEYTKEFDKVIQWKALDRSIKIDVMSNIDNMLVQRFVENEWRDTDNSPLEIFEDIIEGWNKYRYRIKPLESIRITDS